MEGKERKYCSIEGARFEKLKKGKEEGRRLRMRKNGLKGAKRLGQK